eukprot:scaffold192911_cov33-Tisochrysis_lutea.AAC.2
MPSRTVTLVSPSACCASMEQPAQTVRSRVRQTRGLPSFTSWAVIFVMCPARVPPSVTLAVMMSVERQQVSTPHSSLPCALAPQWHKREVGQPLIDALVGARHYGIHI